MAAEIKRMYEIVAEKIIDQLKNGTAPWQKPWNSAGPDFTLPYNAVTNNAYKGLNSLYLHAFSPFSDPRWATFKQAQSQEWQVQKGAKGFMINFVKTHELFDKLDKNGKKILDENGKSIKLKRELSNPIITKAWVFNGEQIKGIPPLKESEQMSMWEKVARAEAIVKDSKAKIFHERGNNAYYSPIFDKIVMPERGQFETADRYYSVLLHELGHWTGHRDRLNRDMTSRQGSPDYAREELRAEIASMMVGAELKIGHDPQQHIAYVDSWIKLLTDKPFEIFAAAADAQKIHDFIIGMERKRELNQEVGKETSRINSKLPEQEHISINKIPVDLEEGNKLTNDLQLPELEHKDLLKLKTR